MKLLLTSGGLRNKTLADAVVDLVDLPVDQLKVAFIPTGLNLEPGDKSWVIGQLNRLKDMGVGMIDIVDVSAVEKSVWLPRLEACNVIFVNGGNTTHLMKCCNTSGLTAEIAELLKSRVYVGASAGSYIATPDLRFNSDGVDEVLDGLKLVSFGIQAHYLSPDFPLAKSTAAVEERVAGCEYPVYAVDDQTAIKVVDGQHEVIGEGEFKLFEPR